MAAVKELLRAEADGALAVSYTHLKDPNSSKWHESQSSGKIEVTDPYNGATEVEAVTLYNYARNDYIWTYLFHYFGNVKGVFLVVVFVVFMALLLRMAVKQKNRLGYMISIGCVLFLICLLYTSFPCIVVLIF